MHRPEISHQLDQMKPVLPHLLALTVKGTITLPVDDDNPIIRKVVFQGTSKHSATYITPGGRAMQMRAYVNTPQSSSPGALSRRGAMRAAMDAWHSASTATRETARDTAKKRKLTLYNAFISLWLLSNPLNAYTTWDGGATSWDLLKTLWDEHTATTWDANATTWDANATKWDTI